jgi:bifunctional non-homologous end joining protein LigD
LRELVEPAGQPISPRLRFVEPVDANPRQLFATACEMGLEGIVSKRLDATYRSGDRSETWVKAKCRPAQEIVIGGWKMNGAKFRSLMGGVWEGEKLRYVGSIHTGYSAANTLELVPQLRAIEAKVSPFNLGSPPRKASEIRWVRPELVAKIEFEGWTQDGKVRQASYKGLREDKPSTEVVEEDPSPMPKAQKRPSVTQKRPSPRAPDFQLSHADKVLWPATASQPAITKADLAAYYAAAADWILPYVHGRPCATNRPRRRDIGQSDDGIGRSSCCRPRRSAQQSTDLSRKLGLGVWLSEARQITGLLAVHFRKSSRQQDWQFRRRRS